MELINNKGEKMKNLQKYLTELPSDSSSEGKNSQLFHSFATDYKEAIKATAKDNQLTLATFSKGYCQCSGFLLNTATGKLAYFNSRDVRYNTLWYESILIRTAEHLEDYTGGDNNFTSLQELGATAKKLTQ